MRKWPWHEIWIREMDFKAGYCQIEWNGHSRLDVQKMLRKLPFNLLKNQTAVSSNEQNQRANG